MKFQSFKHVVEQAANIAACKAAPDVCECKRTEIRERTIRGGSKQYVRQCLDCGESVGNPVKQFGEVAPFDEGLRTRYSENRKQRRDTAHKEKTSEWWLFYEQYMASDEWKALRLQILERDNQRCQGCLTARATEVHHQSYEHLGQEFAFELISLCHGCHQRFHRDE